MDIVSDHVVAGFLHVRILRDAAQPNPQSAFSAQISGPGLSQTVQVGNGVSKDFQLTGVHIGGVPANPTVRLQVENFALVPPGAAADKATAITFILVFKLVEIFQLTIGSVPVSAALH